MKQLRFKITCIAVVVLATVFAQAQTNTTTSLAAKTVNPKDGNSVNGSAECVNATNAKKESVTTLRKAADGGNAEAQFELGKCYANGEGVATNLAEAVKWFRKAAEQGEAGAQTFLADCYLFGRGVAKDEAEALTWFRRAAKQDGYDAKTAKNYLKAVEDGDPEAQWHLAIAYQSGWHCAKNEIEAVKWYRKAAEQGYADAQVCLGKWYLTGEGVPADEAKAVEWIQKAARQGHEEAKQLLNEISK